MRRWIIIALVAIAGVAVAAFLVVRWALDPATLKPIAEARLTAALGQPVTIGTLRWSLLPRLSVQGSDIAVAGSAAARGASLDLRTVRLYPRLSTIFRRPIVIERVEVDGLSLNARRDAAGRLILPLPDPRRVSGGAGAEPNAAAFDVSEVLLRNGRLTIANPRPLTIIDNITAAVQHVGADLLLDRLSASVGRSQVTGSGAVSAAGLRLRLAWMNLTPADLPLVFALLNTSAPPGLVVEGKTPLVLDLAFDSGGQVSASGRLRADRAALGTLAVTSFDSPVHFERNHLALDPMAFAAYGGTGAGRAAVNGGASPAAWSVDAHLQRIDIDRFLTATTSTAGKVSGTAALRAQLRGTAATPMARTVLGTAAFTVADGAVHDFPLLAALYSALKLGASSDRDLQFQSLTGTFAIADERATTTDLLIRTGELTLQAAGTIRFDQAIAFDGTARFSAVKSAQMIRSVHELSSLANADGEVGVPVHVSGTLGTPRFSVDTWSLVRRGVEQELKKRIGDKLREILKKK